MGFFWWTMKKLCLGQVTVDFFNCPKMETFASWWFLSHSCGIMVKTLPNDDCGFKVRCWPKNLTFDCQMTSLPLQLIAKQLGFLTVQLDLVSLETWHVGAWGCIWAYETLLNHWKPQIPWKNQNPNFSCLRRWFDCAILEQSWAIWRWFLTNLWGIWEGKFWGTTSINQSLSTSCLIWAYKEIQKL